MNNVVLVTIWALVRRIGTVAGSALLTFLIQNWMGWTQGAFLANPKTAAVWPGVYLIIEGIQKAWRTSNQVKVAAAVAITPTAR
jgi:hypothetical protein